jgi:AcrR family transcriptional regulator
VIKGEVENSDFERMRRHRRILDVAKAHFEKYGYRRTVIDDIVREVGVAKGTFYLHFKSKRELLIDVVTDMRVGTWKAFLELVSQEWTPAELIRESLRLIYRMMVEEPLFEHLLVGDSNHWLVQELMHQDSYQQELEGTLGFYRDLIQEGIDAGEFRPDLDLELTPFLLGSSKIVFANRELMTFGQVNMKDYLEGIVDMHVRFMLMPGIKPGDKVEARRSRTIPMLEPAFKETEQRTKE